MWLGPSLQPTVKSVNQRVLQCSPNCFSRAGRLAIPLGFGDGGHGFLQVYVSMESSLFEGLRLARAEDLNRNRHLGILVPPSLVVFSAVAHPGYGEQTVLRPVSMSWCDMTAQWT